ncbi:hypothetical protein DS901_15220 [Loktanella sp. D2R18]|uniref:hypothetical protein n=1 Tax=Rhodobacterales TaxID=204455 RepID=UPI000DE99278|nr:MULTISPECIES: hypothetical protein [Rhodobacterales]MDO6588678.1 hypothetical protein [Yoonia sp. 1_MG-2023]RBW42074.1 hypothetical protein DS901_15220 [Loktanella sp. D2R18]
MQKAVKNLSIASIISLLAACATAPTSTSDQTSGGAPSLRASLVNTTVENSFENAIAACANYVVSGTALSSLGSHGFQQSGTKQTIRLENPNALGNSKIVAVPRRGECHVTTSPVAFRDISTVTNWIEPALIQAGFTKQIRPQNEHFAEILFVKNGVTVDVRRSTGAGEFNVILRREQ